MKRKKTITSLKKKAWKLCSEYIRRSHANHKGEAECISCGKRLPWKEIQAGHLVAGRTNAILFELDGIYPQCYVDNIHKHGHTLGYIKGLEKKLGKKEAQKVIDRLYKKSKTTVAFTIEDMENKIRFFKKKIKELDSQIIGKR